MVAVCQLANVPRLARVSLKAWAPIAPKATPDAPKAEATMRQTSFVVLEDDDVSSDMLNTIFF